METEEIIKKLEEIINKLKIKPIDEDMRKEIIQEVANEIGWSGETLTNLRDLFFNIGKREKREEVEKIFWEVVNKKIKESND